MWYVLNKLLSDDAFTVSPHNVLINDDACCFNFIGCCWAFSSVAGTEGANQLKTGNLIPLSEQELVDCAYAGQDHGCEGGLMDDAFQFIQHNEG